MDRTDVAAVAQAILERLETYPLQARIVERADLNGLGPPAAVDAALRQLQRDSRIGSPAPGWYMPLHPFTDQAGFTRYAPPAGLRQLLGSILQRHGIAVVPSRSERMLRAARQAGHHGLDIPNGIHVGIDKPFPLALRWGHAHAITEHDGVKTPMATSDHSDPFGITDTGAFVAACAEFNVDPARTEKDLYVNCLVRAVGDWNQDQDKNRGMQAVLGGGTALSKGWGHTDRFSEDVNLFVFTAGCDPGMPATMGEVDQVTTSLFRHVCAALQQDEVPELTVSRAGHDDALGTWRRTRWLRYAAKCEPDLERAPVVPELQLELNFRSPRGLERAIQAATRSRPRPVRNRPQVLDVPAQTIISMPLVPVPYILAGKLMALADDTWLAYSGQRTHVPGDLTFPRRIRHVIDLYGCENLLAGQVEQLAVLAALQDMGHPGAEFWDVLQEAPALLATEALYGPDAYAEFAVSMLPPAEFNRYLTHAADAYRHLEMLIADLTDLAGHADRQEPDTDRPPADRGYL